MPGLQWPHGRTKDEVRAILEAEFQARGYADHVEWDGYSFRTSVGPFGSLLKVSGRITDDAVIVDTLSGLAAGRVESETRALCEQMFPRGGTGQQPR